MAALLLFIWPSRTASKLLSGIRSCFLDSRALGLLSIYHYAQQIYIYIYSHPGVDGI